jgi:transglutaminase-like putative cysteine protease
MKEPARSDGLLFSLWVALTVAAAARAAVSGEIFGAVALTLFWALIYGAGLAYARSHDGPPPKPLSNGVALVGMIAFLAMLMTSGLVQALMTLVLWLQAARNFALKGRRDAYFALAIGLALITFSAAEARSGFFLVALAIFGFAAFITLLYCHRLHGVEGELGNHAAPGSVKAHPFPILHLGALCGVLLLLASTWYLLIPRPDPIHFGVVPTQGGDQYASESWERESRGQSAGRSGSVPGKSGKDGTADPRPSTDGGSLEQIDITRSGQSGGSIDPNAIVMYVQADRPLYLRRLSFDRFENDRWSASDTRLRKILPQEGEFNLPGPDMGDKVRYTVQIVSAKTDTLPLSAHAKQVVAPASVIGLSRDGAVHLPRFMEPGFGYAATSILPVDIARPIAHDVPADPAPYLQLPEDFSPRIAGLAREVTASAATPLDRAAALESHLRSAYAYSFETVLTSQGVTPLDAFLFETRRGHCEFFASAMAVMLRGLGIPSRVVHGYLAHNLNPVTGFYEVRAFDGHAWVEAHIDGRGWMTFEPTAAYPAPQRKPQTGTALFDLKTYTEQLALQEALQGRWSSKATIAAVLRQVVEFWHASVLKLRVALENLGNWLSAHAPVLAATVFLSASLAAAAYFFRASLLLLWAQLALRLTPAAKVPLAAFRHLERLARTRQLGKEATETADEYIDRLLIDYAAQENELNLLRRAFNTTRYGGAKWTQINEVAQAFLVVGAALKGGAVRSTGAA